MRGLLFSVSIFCLSFFVYQCNLADVLGVECTGDAQCSDDKKCIVATGTCSDGSAGQSCGVTSDCDEGLSCGTTGDDKNKCVAGSGGPDVENSCLYTVSSIKVCLGNATSSDANADFEKACLSSEVADPSGEDSITKGLSGSYRATFPCSERTLGDSEEYNANYCKGASVKSRYKLTDDADPIIHTFTGDLYVVSTDELTCHSGTKTPFPTSE